MNGLTLTDEEVAAITRRETAAAQGRVLRLMGIPFATHPLDPVLVVSRAAAEAVLGGPVAVSANEEFSVDIEAMRGKKTTAR